MHVWTITVVKRRALQIIFVVMSHVWPEIEVYRNSVRTVVTSKRTAMISHFTEILDGRISVICVLNARDDPRDEEDLKSCCWETRF